MLKKYCTLRPLVITVKLQRATLSDNQDGGLVAQVGWKGLFGEAVQDGAQLGILVEGIGGDTS